MTELQPQNLSPIRRVASALNIFDEAASTSALDDYRSPRASSPGFGRFGTNADDYRQRSGSACDISSPNPRGNSASSARAPTFLFNEDSSSATSSVKKSRALSAPPVKQGSSAVSKEAVWLHDESHAAHSHNLEPRVSQPALWLNDEEIVSASDASTSQPKPTWLVEGSAATTSASRQIQSPQALSNSPRFSKSRESHRDDFELFPIQSSAKNSDDLSMFSIPSSRRTNERSLEDVVLGQYRELLRQVRYCSLKY